MKEPIIIVDENDRPVGLAERSTIDYATQIYRVAALWVVNTKGYALIAQRKWTKQKDPGLWGPSVAGTVERGETYKQNIVKETFEEIGLQDVEVLPVKKTYMDTPRRYFCQWFVARIDWIDTANFKIQEDEVEAVAWITVNDLVRDYKNFPEKYIPSFAKSLEVLKEAL